MVSQTLALLCMAVLVVSSAVQATKPNDPELEKQWYLSMINVPKVWDLSFAMHETIVAVVDTGADFNHSDLQGRFWINPHEIANNSIDDDHNGYVDDINGWDFQGNDNSPMDEDKTKTGHGTISCGVIAATMNNGIGIVGINQNVKLMILRAFNSDGVSTPDIIARAIDYAVDNGAQVINASFGGYSKKDSAPFIAAIERAQQKDIVVVTSAGNSNSSNDTLEFYPGNLRMDNVISVAASSNDDRKWQGSNFGGRNVDIAAPGFDIYTTKLGNTYGAVRGTSIATAVVSGVAALMRSVAPKLSSAALKTTMLQTGAEVDIETVCRCRIDAYQAVSSVVARSSF